MNSTTSMMGDGYPYKETSFTSLHHFFLTQQLLCFDMFCSSHRSLSSFLSFPDCFCDFSFLLFPVCPLATLFQSPYTPLLPVLGTHSPIPFYLQPSLPGPVTADSRIYMSCGNIFLNILTGCLCSVRFIPSATCK